MKLPDIKLIEENYAHMPDWKLEQIAMSNSAGMRQEVIEIIKRELEKRSLNMDLMRGVEAQNKEHTVEEIGNYCELLRELSCPICKSTLNKLNAAQVYTVTGYLILTASKEELIIACPSCLDKAHKDANTNNLFFGWWGIPWGPIKTVQYVLKNNNQKDSNHNTSPSNVLRSFTLSNIGEIELYKDDKEKLESLINNINAH